MEAPVSLVGGAAGQMLRLLYADSGTVEDLLAAIGALREWASTRFVAGRAQVTEYLQPTEAFPRRRHIQVLFARFFASLYRAVLDWCDLAETEVSGWDRTREPGPGPAHPRPAGGDAGIADAVS